MPRHTLSIGPITIVLSALWTIWIFVFVPTQITSYGTECSQLQSLTKSAQPEFISSCVQVMSAQAPEGTLSRLLLTTCAALVLLSVVIWLRERKLLAAQALQTTEARTSDKSNP